VQLGQLDGLTHVEMVRLHTPTPMKCVHTTNLTDDPIPHRPRWIEYPPQAFTPDSQPSTSSPSIDPFHHRIRSFLSQLAYIYEGSVKDVFNEWFPSLTQDTLTPTIGIPLNMTQSPSQVLPHALDLPIFSYLKDKRAVLASASPRRKELLEASVSSCSFPERSRH
jgi:hypothetical protein